MNERRCKYPVKSEHLLGAENSHDRVVTVYVQMFCPKRVAVPYQSGLIDSVLLGMLSSLSGVDWQREKKEGIKHTVRDKKGNGI